MPVTVQYTGARPLDVPVNVLDISRASQELNWSPKVTLDEGLAITWQWLKSLHQGEGEPLFLR